jgi:hypothetical protein
MTDFLYPTTFTERNKIMGFVRTPNYHVFCNLNKDKICDVMNIILIKFCKVSVCGYNKENDEYFGKIIKKNICELYFTILVVNTGENKSTILIKISNGNKTNVNELLENIIDGVRLYED